MYFCNFLSLCVLCRFSLSPTFWLPVCLLCVKLMCFPFVGHQVVCVHGKGRERFDYWYYNCVGEILTCIHMGPNMGEWSPWDWAGFCNLIPSLISLLSKANITPSLENHDLFTGFHRHYRECNRWPAQAQIPLFLPLPHGFLPLLHTEHALGQQPYPINRSL